MLHLALLKIVAAAGLYVAPGLTSGSPSNLPHLRELVLPHFPPLAFFPLHHLPLLLSTFGFLPLVASPLPSSLLIIS